MMRLRCGKVRRARRRARREFGYQQSMARDAIEQSAVLARIAQVEPAAADGDGRATGSERRLVRSRIDAARQPLVIARPAATRSRVI